MALRHKVGTRTQDRGQWAGLWVFKKIAEAIAPEVSKNGVEKKLSSDLLSCVTSPTKKKIYALAFSLTLLKLMPLPTPLLLIKKAMSRVKGEVLKYEVIH